MYAAPRSLRGASTSASRPSREAAGRRHPPHLHKLHKTKRPQLLSDKPGTGGEKPSAHDSLGRGAKDASLNQPVTPASKALNNSKVRGLHIPETSETARTKAHPSRKQRTLTEHPLNASPTATKHLGRV